MILDWFRRDPESYDFKVPDDIASKLKELTIVCNKSQKEADRCRKLVGKWIDKYNFNVAIYNDAAKEIQDITKKFLSNLLPKRRKKLAITFTDDLKNCNVEVR